MLPMQSAATSIDGKIGTVLLDVATFYSLFGFLNRRHQRKNVHLLVKIFKAGFNSTLSLFAASY